MGRPKAHNQKAKYNALNARLEKYLQLVSKVYEAYNLEAAKIATSVGYDGEKPFSFADYPITKQRVQELLNGWRGDLRAIITKGTATEWGKSNMTQDLLADKVLSYYYGKEHGRRKRKYYQTNPDSLKAFQQRKDNGMNLSQKIWDQSKGYKEELEAALSAGIQKGMSAVTLSKRVSKYLTDFDKLKDDYKQRYGKETDCLNCEYRSMRLARSEINMAYRTAEQERWQQMDFVVGIEIKLSHSHHDRMPHGDICDDLQGKYPKDFKWTGWHPNDMCYMVPILKTEEEFFSDDDTPCASEVTEVPKQYKDWCLENSDRIIMAEKRGTLPYFIRENMSESMPSTANYYAPITQKDIDYLVSQNMIAPQAAPILLSDTPEVAQRRLSEIVMPSVEHSVYGYAEYYKENEEVQLLLSEIKRMEKHNEVGRAKLISKLKDVCADEYKKELQEWGVVGGLDFRKVEKNTTIVRRETLKTSSGEKVMTDAVYKDLVVYRGKNGIEYAYPIGTRKGDLLFDASQAEKIISTMPTYLKANVSRVSFVNEINPQDLFWKKEYGKDHISAATDGKRITFWEPSRGQSAGTFFGRMCHESGHIYDANHRLSTSVLWNECVENDIALYPHRRIGFPSSYAMKRPTEDFAESVRLYIDDPVWFKKYYPNRASFLENAIKKYPKR